MPTALHGMIWMTRAFFMLAGRLPVLMFSFMIRTLVSFCNQGKELEDDGPEAGNLRRSLSPSLEVALTRGD